MAYRSRPRPSSAPGAKASTVCPYYLDGDPNDVLHKTVVRVIPVPTTRALEHKGHEEYLLCSFQRPPKSKPTATSTASRSFKTQQHEQSPPSLDAGNSDQVRSTFRTPTAKAEGAAHLSELPRKEVIQPHLPVRLPCYDFTPVTSPTFDGSLPCGLGHRLRVLLTPVV